MFKSMIRNSVLLYELTNLFICFFFFDSCGIAAGIFGDHPECDSCNWERCCPQVCCRQSGKL